MTHPHPNGAIYENCTGLFFPMWNNGQSLEHVTDTPCRTMEEAKAVLDQMPNTDTDFETEIIER